MQRAFDATQSGFDGVGESIRAVEATQDAKRDIEIQELRRMLAAKDSSLDSLRESLASTKQSTESKMKRLQQQLDQAQNDVSANMDTGMEYGAATVDMRLEE